MKCTSRKHTQPGDWWESWQAQADREGLTLSAWIGECCNAQLGSAARRSLSKRPPASRPKLDKAEE